MQHGIIVITNAYFEWNNIDIVLGLCSYAYFHLNLYSLHIKEHFKRIRNQINECSKNSNLIKKCIMHLVNTIVLMKLEEHSFRRL